MIELYKCDNNDTESDMTSVIQFVSVRTTSAYYWAVFIVILLLV